MKHTELIERLRAGSGGMKHWQELESEAADAIEALQAENERLEHEKHEDSELWRKSILEREQQISALQSQLDAMGKGEAVAHRAWFDADNGARWLFTLWPEEERLDVEWEPLYAAPKALAPLLVH